MLRKARRQVREGRVAVVPTRAGIGSQARRPDLLSRIPGQQWFVTEGRLERIDPWRGGHAEGADALPGMPELMESR